MKNKTAKSNQATIIAERGSAGVDRRIAYRKTTEDLSSIVVNIDGRKITCLVHNVSDTGAMIQTSIRDLPARFILDNPSEGIRRACKVVWSEGDMTGIEFVRTVQVRG